MDAKASLTNEADADGKAVWSRCPDAGIKSATMPRHHADDGGNKPVTEESAEETVKTIAQEMPDDFR